MKKISKLTVNLKKSANTKTVCYWHRDKRTDQWNSTENPEINLYVYGELTFDKGAETIQRSKHSLHQKWYRHDSRFMRKRRNSGRYLHTIHKH